MASLSSLLNKNQGTFNTSEEELQNLTNKAQLPSAPITPLGATMIGAGPQSSKMAGSSQQKAAAIRQAIQGSEEYGTQARQAQPRKTQTTEEQQAKERAEKLSGLGSLENRVQELTDKMLAGQSTTSQLQVNEDQLKASGVPQENTGEFKGLLTKLTGQGASLDDIKRMNEVLGRNASNLLNADQIKQMFAPVSQQVGATITNAIQNNISVGNLDQTQLQQLGFANQDELAQTLNIPTANLQSMTIPQLQEKIAQIKSGEYSKTQKLQQQASDPNLGAAERAEARSLLREAGAVGTRSSDEKVADLQQQVEGADTVDFAGKQYSVQELLSDETLNGVIDRYFKDPAYKDELLKSEPKFSDWLNQNEQAIKGMLDKVDPSVKAFNEIQSSRSQAAKTANGTTLSDDVMKLVHPDWGSLSSSNYDPSSEPEALKLVKSTTTDPKVRANIEQFLDESSKENPEVAKQFLGLNRQELASLGVFDQGSQGLQDYLNYNTQIKAANSSQSPEEFLNNVFGMNLQESQQLIKQANSLRHLGVSIPGLDLLDANHDGQVDDLNSLKQNVLGPGKILNPDTSIRGMLNAGMRLSDIPKPMTTNTKMKDSLRGVDPDILKLSEYTQDGEFDRNDSQKLSNETDFNTLSKLLNNPNVNFKSETGFLKQALDQKATEEINNTIGPQLSEQLNQLAAGKFRGYQSEKDLYNQGMQKLSDRLKTETNPDMKNALQTRINYLKNSDMGLAMNGARFITERDGYRVVDPSGKTIRFTKFTRD